MSPVLAPDRPLTLDLEPRLEPGPRGRTLEDLVHDTWGALLTGARPACPVCATELTPRESAGSGVVGGRCDGCGSSLA